MLYIRAFEFCNGWVPEWISVESYARLRILPGLGSRIAIRRQSGVWGVVFGACVLSLNSGCIRTWALST